MVQVLRFLVALGDSVSVQCKRLVDLIEGATVPDDLIPLRQTTAARRGSDVQGPAGQDGPFS